MGTLYQRGMAQQTSLGCGPQSWVSSTVGPKGGWTRSITDPCQVDLDGKRLIGGSLPNWQLLGCDWPLESTPAFGSVGVAISKTLRQSDLEGLLFQTSFCSRTINYTNIY